MKIAIRAIYVLGLIAVLVASSVTFRNGGAEWFVQAIYVTCVAVGVTLLTLWGISEVFVRYIPVWWVHVVILIASIGGLAFPAFYLMMAALYGERHAEFQTWHLLPMFALLRVIMGLVIGTVIGSILACIVAFLRLLIHSVRSSDQSKDETIA